MNTALRIILILVVAWYIIRLINRYIVPVLFGRSDKNKKQPGTRGKEYRKSTRQGEVTITDYGRPSRDEKADPEDYVDYEEVD